MPTAAALTPSRSVPHQGGGSLTVFGAARRRGHRMNRRELLPVIGGAFALAPLGATAQPGLPVIGAISANAPRRPKHRCGPGSWTDWSNGALSLAGMSRSNTASLREASI